jgi:hypothetical protein
MLLPVVLPVAVLLPVVLPVAVLLPVVPHQCLCLPVEEVVLPALVQHPVEQEVRVHPRS